MNERCSKCKKTFQFPAYLELHIPIFNGLLKKFAPACPYCDVFLYGVDYAKEEEK